MIFRTSITGDELGFRIKAGDRLPVTPARWTGDNTWCSNLVPAFDGDSPSTRGFLLFLRSVANIPPLFLCHNDWPFFCINPLFLNYLGTGEGYDSNALFPTNMRFYYRKYTCQGMYLWGWGPNFANKTQFYKCWMVLRYLPWKSSF